MSLTTPVSPSGIGLRASHIGAVCAQTPCVGFLEVHTENYFGGGAKLKMLERLRADYPLSFHGVGLSLGSACGFDVAHANQVVELVNRFEPILVSELLS